MKIAIITFSDFNTNYGSMLQSFSLGHYLKKQGHDVVWIKYREFTDDSENRIALKSYIKKILLKLYAIYRRKDLLNTKQNFEAYKQKWLKYTALYVSEKELEQMTEEYDCCICGSDQIWNLECLGGLRTPYFLKFVSDDKKKIAYAASMGDYHFKDDEKKRVAELLQKIDYISVREKDSVDEIHGLSKKEVISVVDPVFLTDVDEWNTFSGESPIKGKYGVCYFVRRSKFGKRVIKEVARYYKCPIYNLSDNMIYINGTESRYISVGPMEFLAILKGAKFAIGTSFHLTAFSIIFNVPFLTIGMESNRARVNNILELVGLEKQFVTENDNYKEKIKELSNVFPNYEKLKQQIEKSEHFLNKALF